MSSRSHSPLSEGEIVSEDEEKAISTNTNARDSKVNSSARLNSWSSSRAPQQSDRMEALMTDKNYHFRDAERVSRRRERSRSRSPYRAGKPTSGDKRRHEDDHYSKKDASDPRRFKVHYEEGSGHRSRQPYADLDRPDEQNGQLSYDDDRGGRSREPALKLNRNRGHDRDRSRSPFRHTNVLSNDQPNGSQRLSDGTTEAKTRVRNELESTARSLQEQNGAKVKMSLSQHSKSKSNQDDKTSALQSAILTAPAGGRINKDAESMEGHKEPQEQLSEAELIEQRRKRREAIKARHKTDAPLLVKALEQNMQSAPATPVHDSSGVQSEQQSPPSSTESPRTPYRDSPPDSPATFIVENDEELADRRITDGAANDDEGPSAADYDPNLDMEEDRPDHKRTDMHIQQNDVTQAADSTTHQREQDIEPKQSKEFDMFADDDDDDMFAPADATSKPSVTGTKQAKALDQSLLDNWDYPDGHYRIILGELLDGRYAIQQQIGKGTFATVVRAHDTRTGNPVAVKIACNNETMYKAGLKEMEMLELLNKSDPEDKKHVIRLLRNFDHKGHLCLVFESLSADLREVLKKFGRNIGISIKAIRTYAQQMFLSLSHMKKSQILHADLKPDNILVSEKRNLLKVCDLGTASFAYDAEVTPYLVSRFYRAPEVILGMPFDYAIDMWSIGCTLFELYTGRILFAGADNNQMLRAIQECRGKFPMRMLKKATMADKYFDIDGNFFSQERDKVTGKATLRQMSFIKTAPGKDLRSRLSGNIKGMSPEEAREHAAFLDLMDKCLQLDPARRITPNEALRHSFIVHSGQPQAEKSAPAVKVAMNIPRKK